MTQTFSFKLALYTAALLAIPAVQAADMTKTDYQSAKTRIKAELNTAKTSCDSQSGNAKDVCVEEAKAKEKVGLADLEYSYTGKAADRNSALKAKAEATYAVAKERCDDLSGTPKDVCVKEAKATETKALADAKMGKEISEARKDAATDRMDADYKVAAEKCNLLAGDAKSSCLTTAKQAHGKS